MAHHGSEDVLLAKLSRLQEKLGATGRYPQGKLCGGDEGEIQLAVGVEKDAVVLAFGKEVAWIGFTPQQAVEVAQDLIRKARAISTEPLTVEIG